MKPLLLFSGLFLLASYGNYGNKEHALWGIVCLVVLFAACWNPSDNPIEDEGDEWETTTEQGIG